VRRLAALVPAAVLVLDAALPAAAADAPPAVRVALARGTPQQVVVLLDAGGVRPGAARYRALKDRLRPVLAASGIDVTREYSELPMVALRVRSAQALERLAARAEVREIFENRPYYPQLAQSLPLVGQLLAAAAGATGEGATVAVIDTAVNYTEAAFGPCSAPGVPAGCKVAAAVELVPDTGAPDNNGHGTNVAAIVLGVAPRARVASLDAFNDGTALTVDLVEGVNWAIANRAAYNIVAINMSFGDTLSYDAPCVAGNPLHAPIQEAHAAGILTVVASGNQGYSAGISSPACTPNAVSVGAVYDANLGAVTWSSCSDPGTAPGQVVCFSNSGSLLTLLAPGALITAGGASGGTRGGTSQAAPHIAGAAAVLRAAFPGDTPGQTVARLTSAGTPVTDPRNGLVRPLLALEDSTGAGASLAEADIPAVPWPGLALMALLLIRLAGSARSRRA
jgi:subtilisin family serine protease